MSKSVKEIIATMNEEQQAAMYSMIGAVMDDGELEHADTIEKQQTIIGNSYKHGSLKESYLAHAEEYGISNIKELFPNDKLVGGVEFINNNVEWVDHVLSNVHKQPFSRVRTMSVDLTADEIRAKGYTKGNRKVEDVMTVLKRSTSPTTIYKKQKLDRDDIIDITDFDVVAWIKAEMKLKLNEEIARCILFGDGRTVESDHHVSESCMRPIIKDDALYTIKSRINPSADNKYKEFVRNVIKSRKEYKGSGTPTLFVGEDVVSELLLIEDNNGRFIYPTVDSLASTLRVSKIITIPEMDGMKLPISDTQEVEILGLIVNLKDYGLGADKGGEESLFEDFDIDYNQQKYLIETRKSGALIKAKSAIVIEGEVSNITYSLDEDEFLEDTDEELQNE